MKFYNSFLNKIKGLDLLNDTIKIALTENNNERYSDISDNVIKEDVLEFKPNIIYIYKHGKKKFRKLYKVSKNGKWKEINIP